MRREKSLTKKLKRSQIPKMNSLMIIPTQTSTRKTIGKIISSKEKLIKRLLDMSLEEGEHVVVEGQDQEEATEATEEKEEAEADEEEAEEATTTTKASTTKSSITSVTKRTTTRMSNLLRETPTSIAIRTTNLPLLS